MPVIDTHAHRARAVSAFSQGIAEISQSSPHTAAKVRRACTHTHARVYREDDDAAKGIHLLLFSFMYLGLWCSGLAALSLCHCLSFVATIEIIAQ